jgi:hypothetical protein
MSRIQGDAMKKLRTLKIVVLVVVVLIAVAMIGLYLGADALATTGVERGATYAMGVNTTVDSLHLRLLSGGLTMRGLTVANPEGYASDHFLKSGTFDVQVQPASVFGDPVVIDHFELDGLDVNIEQKLTGSNVGAITDNLKRLASAKTEEDKGPGKKVKVSRIVIKDVVAHFHLPTSAAGTGPITVKVPEIVMTDVDSGRPQGILISQLVAKIVPAVLAQVARDAQGVVPGDVLGSLDKNIASVKSQLDESGKKLQDAFGGILNPGNKGK